MDAPVLHLVNPLAAECDMDESYNGCEKRPANGPLPSSDVMEGAGFVSAGDERRAYGQNMAEIARNAERKKFEALYRAREAVFMTEKASFLEEILRLKALFAQNG